MAHPVALFDDQHGGTCGTCGLFDRAAVPKAPDDNTI
ncbi:hypothetical protein HNQ07_004161 [Deinococcus metalli]|uniref:Uncharacterized protein n=1 Tax=Deinococcus metalli TaxID=1141878 RepID=A0A7W8KI51_9DEIO|nr:hypothetical protein [Deinococcus metalli]